VKKESPIMNSRKKTVFSLFLVAGFATATCFGQSAPAKKNPAGKIALVSFVNACSTNMQEHWKASIDIYFKGNILSQDLRMGEASLLQSVENDGEGFVEIRRHATEQVLKRVPASLTPGTFNTVLVTGRIDSGASAVEALVLRDYPLQESQIRPDRARLVIVSGIMNYPTNVIIAEQVFKNLKPGVATEVFMPPGEHEIKMYFKDNKLGPGDHNTLSGILAEAGRSYNVVFFDSPRKPGRPRVMVTDITQLRQDFVEASKNEDKESEESGN
jgi:hypothetical protein